MIDALLVGEVGYWEIGQDVVGQAIHGLLRIRLVEARFKRFKGVGDKQELFPLLPELPYSATLTSLVAKGVGRLKGAVTNKNCSHLYSDFPTQLL